MKRPRGVEILVILGVVVALGVSLLLLARAKGRAQLRAVQDWASTRGFEYHTDGPGWVYQLPGHANAGVMFRVEGSRGGFPFTVAYAHFSEGESSVEFSLVVLHLRQAYPAAQVRRRRARVPTGHPEFDRRFRVRTDHPGGPPAVISPALAAAMVNEALPLWAVSERELICFTASRWRTERFDQDVTAALRIAALLGLR